MDDIQRRLNQATNKTYKDGTVITREDKKRGILEEEFMDTTTGNGKTSELAL